MKLLRVLLALLVPSLVMAQPYTTSEETSRLISFGVTPEVANEVTQYIGGGNGLINVTLVNNTYLKARNAADTASIDVLKVDASDDTILNADTGDTVNLAVAGTGVVSVSGSLVSSTMDLAFATNKTIAIQEATAGTACSGTATANGTTAVTVSTTCALTGSRILIARNAAPSGTAICWTTNIVNGVSFDLDCSAAETSTFNWFVIHEAA